MRGALGIAKALFLLSMIIGGVGFPSCDDTLPDCFRNTVELIAAYGFMPQTHTCRTQDGYLLALFRVFTRNTTAATGRDASSKGTVLLLHGLLDSSDTWLLNGRKGSLALVLADAGYDVWLGNNRGNKYSTAHETLLPSQDEFWEWSWDELARYDVPAMVNYISMATGGSNVSLIGHSQGTLQTFASLSHPSTSKILAGQINLFIALAPIAYLTHMSSPLLQVLAHVPEEEYTVLFGKKDFLPSNELMRTLLAAVCVETPYVCKSFACMFSGCDPSAMGHYNATRLPVYSSHYPAGTSVRNMIHFSQMVRLAPMRMFDFGSTTLNMKAYGTPTPPSYNLTDVRGVPVALLMGSLDILADSEDVAALVKELPAEVVVVKKVIQGWDHIAFCVAQDGGTLLFPEVLMLLSTVSSLRGRTESVVA